MTEYERLRDQIRALQASGELPRVPTDEQRVDFAFGNTAIENPKITREMAERVFATDYPEPRIARGDS